MRSAQVIDQQNDLHARLTGSPVFWECVAECFAQGLGVRETRSSNVARELGQAGAWLADLHAGHVRKAYAWHVSEDVSAVAEHAAATLDDTDAFDLALAPSPYGMARFDRPLAFTDVRGDAIKGHWIVWGPATINNADGVLVVVYNDTDDPYEPLDVVEGRRPIMGRWSWVGATFQANGEAVGEPLLVPEQEQAARVAADGVEPRAASNPLRYLHALWLLLGQPLAAIVEPDLSRADRKRHGRMPVPGKVSVIGLRRGQTSTRGDGESLVEWQHRWLVRGHWRWQPVGPVGRGAVDLHDHQWGDKVVSVGSIHRPCQVVGCRRVLSRLWVTGHVKGPEDKPLVVRDKVTRVTG